MKRIAIAILTIAFAGFTFGAAAAPLVPPQTPQAQPQACPWVINDSWIQAFLSKFKSAKAT
jgi:hypothetical protein